MRALALLLVVASMLTLAACGRKNDPLPPPGYPRTQAPGKVAAPKATPKPEPETLPGQVPAGDAPLGNPQDD